MRYRKFVAQDTVPAKTKAYYTLPSEKGLHKNDVAGESYVPQERRPALLKSSALMLILIMLSFSLFAETVLQQGFEDGPGDNWNYTAIPEPGRATWWGVTDQPLGGASAQSGDWYWASWNLQNENHALSFDSVALSPGYVYTLHFYYYTKDLNSTAEYSRYCLEYDAGDTWTNCFDLQPDTNAWTFLSVEIPTYATSLRLKVEAFYDGTGKYAHWDAFTLHRTLAPPMAPDVYNVSALQRTEGSKIVDIHYDIFDINDDFATVSVLLSQNSGVSFNYQPLSANLSGDIGDNISTGTNRHIIWNAGAEGIDYDNSTYRIRVLVDDHTTANIVESPIFSPAGGTYTQPQTVSLYSNTTGASIYYSTDGSDPNETCILYTGPITIGTNTTLKARAYKELWWPSLVTTAEYIIVPAGFVYVPGGTFTMGDTRGTGESNELPAHSVTLDSFYMSKFEVKQLEYVTVMGFNPAHGFGEGPNHPAYYISWYSALKYCNLRSMSEGITPVYTIGGSTNPADWGGVPTSNNSTWNDALCDWTANGYRLPTEAEWEYAARGGANIPDYLYSGSDTVSPVAWYSLNSGYVSHQVGSKDPNALGLFDMSGNVYEWCWDTYGIYDSAPANNPTGPDNVSDRSSRIRRGGYYESNAIYCRVSFRGNNQASSGFRGIGFRICRGRL